jgi:hypothetical protein
MRNRQTQALGPADAPIYIAGLVLFLLVVLNPCVITDSGRSQQLRALLKLGGDDPNTTMLQEVSAGG